MSTARRLVRPEYTTHEPALRIFASEQVTIQDASSITTPWACSGDDSLVEFGRRAFMTKIDLWDFVAPKVFPQFWFCDDCAIATVNDDYSGIENLERGLKVEKAVQEFANHYQCVSTVDDQELDFSSLQCACCGTDLAGHRFLMMGEEL